MYWGASVRFAHYDSLWLHWIIIVNNSKLHPYINWTFNLFNVITNEIKCSFERYQNADRICSVLEARQQNNICSSVSITEKVAEP